MGNICFNLHFSRFTVQTLHGNSAVKHFFFLQPFHLPVFLLLQIVGSSSLPFFHGSRGKGPNKSFPCYLLICSQATLVGQT